MLRIGATYTFRINPKEDGKGKYLGSFIQENCSEPTLLFEVYSDVSPEIGVTHGVMFNKFNMFTKSLALITAQHYSLEELHTVKFYTRILEDIYYLPKENCINKLFTLYA